MGECRYPVRKPETPRLLSIFLIHESQFPSLALCNCLVLNLIFQVYEEQQINTLFFENC